MPKTDDVTSIDRLLMTNVDPDGWRIFVTKVNELIYEEGNTNGLKLI